MTCRICPREPVCRGLCSRHYSRLRRHGDPTGGGPQIPELGGRLDAGPLLDAVDGRVAHPRARMTAADYRALMRTRERGWVHEGIADRIACSYLSTPLELIYQGAA